MNKSMLIPYDIDNQSHRMANVKCIRQKTGSVDDLSYILDKRQVVWYMMYRNCSQPDQPYGLRLGYF